ncbi:MAG: DUF4893 domain-containing protein, partial [Proteobacteria bacterium]|nr:DUF4893 domain-containing protein [Pseudomonadota bacterium]
NGTAYMVLDYEAGQSFKSWLDALGRPPTQPEMDALMSPLLDALAYVHGQGLLHRDLAPDNIIIRPDGTPCLIDFGAARQAVAEVSQVMSAIVKSGFSPPEQYTRAGKAQGPWSDIYALGATCYRAVSGKVPPEATERQIDDEYVPLASAIATAKSYRPSFLKAVDAALLLRYSERPQSVEAWRAMLMNKEQVGVAKLPDVAPASPAAKPSPTSVNAEPVSVPGPETTWNKIAQPSGFGETTQGVTSRTKSLAISAALLLLLMTMAMGAYLRSSSSNSLAPTQQASPTPQTAAVGEPQLSRDKTEAEARPIVGEIRRGTTNDTTNRVALPPSGSADTNLANIAALAQTLTPADQARIAELEASRRTAIDFAQQTRNSESQAALRAALALLALPAQPLDEAQLVGTWRCRTYSLGGSLGDGDPQSGLGTEAGKTFNCRISRDKSGLVFNQLSGSLTRLARLTPIPGTSALLYAGTNVSAGDRQLSYPNGDPYNHEVGILVQVSAGR